MGAVRRLCLSRVLPLVIFASCGLAVAALPSCRFRANMEWQTCSHFNLSTYCCLGGNHFAEPIHSTIVFDDRGSTRSANISFNSTFDVKSSFLVSGVRARGCGCGLRSVCYNVVPDSSVYYEPIQVELSFLPGDQVLEVTRLDEKRFKNWISHTATNESEEREFLHASNITIDLVGPDAHLRLIPPSENAVAPKVMSSACVTLYSDTKDFSCDDHCQCTHGRDQVTKSLCLDRPYDKRVLQVENVTSFYNGKHRFLFHWIVMRIGGSCLTARQNVHLPSVLVPVLEIPSKGIEFGVICAGIAAAAVVLAVGARCLLVFLSKRKKPPIVGPLHQHERLLPTGGQSEVVLLYRKDHNNKHFQKSLQSLRIIVGHSDHVMVRDPYEESMLCEEGPVRTAQAILTKPNIYILYFATERDVQVERGDIFDQFFDAAIRHIQENPKFLGAGHIFTLITNEDLNLFTPWDENIYFLSTNVRILTDKINDLLNAIPGAHVRGRSLQIQAQLTRLSRHLQNLNRNFSAQL